MRGIWSNLPSYTPSNAQKVGIDTPLYFTREEPGGSSTYPRFNQSPEAITRMPTPRCAASS